MKDKVMKISKLVASDYNPRCIDAEALERLKLSITEHSKAIDATGGKIRLANTITVNKQGNRIIGGHQRVKALIDLGITDIMDQDITWVDLEPESAEEKALNISLNNPHISGEWDEIKLNDLLSDISKIDKDLFELLDFDMLKTIEDDIEGETEADVIPEINNDETASKLGKIYSLGGHRLLCGDAIKTDNHKILLNDVKVDFVLSDQPYGIDLNFNSDKQSKNGLTVKQSYKKILNDEDILIAEYILDICMDLYYECKIVIWGSNYYNTPPAKCWLSWFKKKDLPSDTFCDTEFAWTNINKHSHTICVKWKGMIKEGESGLRVHPNQKPILLYEKMFTYLDAGKVILDLCSGSGTAFIASEKTGRICYGVELDEYYCDVIRKRWAEFVHGEGSDWITLTPEII